MHTRFPVLEQDAPYLNHAAVGPWPRATAEAVQAFADENMRHGSANYFQWLERERALREMLARLTGAPSADDIALLKNTTECISTVAWGLDWQPGENVVLPAAEFPSNRLPWLAQAARGVEAREVDIRATEDAERALIDAMDANTRLLTVSSVQWADGFRLDLERLGKACRKRGVLFFVDAIQQLGALPIDVEAAQADFLAADAHKWLLAPEGIAVFFCRADVRPQLQLLQQGWHMVDRSWDFDRTEWPVSETAVRFEAGSPNTMGQAALHASAGLLLDHGIDRVAAAILANTDRLMRELVRIDGIRLNSRTEPSRRSGIVSFRHETIAPGALYQGLKERGISCALREGGVRVSPHFYQGDAELDVFLEALAHIV
ncbi:MAG: aminotransferase class V-fold PLP-dependent enzyme [Xanthomonadales bacterium]